jgi:hypothetical protein
LGGGFIAQAEEQTDAGGWLSVRRKGKSQKQDRNAGAIHHEPPSVIQGAADSLTISPGFGQCKSGLLKIDLVEQVEEIRPELQGLPLSPNSGHHLETPRLGLGLRRQVLRRCLWLLLVVR